MVCVLSWGKTICPPDEQMWLSWLLEASGCCRALDKSSRYQEHYSGGSEDSLFMGREGIQRSSASRTVDLWPYD